MCIFSLMIYDVFLLLLKVFENLLRKGQVFLFFHGRNCEKLSPLLNAL